MADAQNRTAADGQVDLRRARVQRIERNPAGQLVVHLEGCDEPVVDVHIARCFPWSVPDAYISVRNADDREVALLDSLDELDPDSREIAAAELRDKTFNPMIRRVLECKDEFGISSITAETDRGKVIFQIHGRDDVRLLSATRALRAATPSPSTSFTLASASV